MVPAAQRNATGADDGERIRKVETRFAPENLSGNLALVDLLKRWGEDKSSTLAQAALVWLMAQKP